MSAQRSKINTFEFLTFFEQPRGNTDLPNIVDESGFAKLHDALGAHPSFPASFATRSPTRSECVHDPGRGLSRERASD